MAIPFHEGQGHAIVAELVERLGSTKWSADYLTSLLKKRLDDYNTRHGRRLSLEDFERERHGYLCRAGLIDLFWSEFSDGRGDQDDPVVRTAVIRGALEGVSGAAVSWEAHARASFAEHTRSFAQPADPLRLARVITRVNQQGPIARARFQDLRAIVQRIVGHYIEERGRSLDGTQLDWCATEQIPLERFVADMWLECLVRGEALDPAEVAGRVLRQRGRIPAPLQIRLAVATLADISRGAAQAETGPLRQELGDLVGIIAQLAPVTGETGDLWWIRFEKTARGRTVNVRGINSVAALRQRLTVLQWTAGLTGYREGLSEVDNAIKRIPRLVAVVPAPAPPPPAAKKGPKGAKGNETVPAVAVTVDWESLGLRDLPIAEVAACGAVLQAAARVESSHIIIFRNEEGTIRAIPADGAEYERVKVLASTGGPMTLSSGDRIIFAALRFYGPLDEPTRGQLRFLGELFTDPRFEDVARFFYLFGYQIAISGGGLEGLLASELRSMIQNLGFALTASDAGVRMERVVGGLVGKGYIPAQIARERRLIRLLGDTWFSEAGMNRISEFSNPRGLDLIQMVLDYVVDGGVPDEETAVAGRALRQYEQSETYDATAVQSLHDALQTIYPVAVESTRRGLIDKASLAPELRDRVAACEELFRVSLLQLAQFRDLQPDPHNPAMGDFIRLSARLSSLADGKLAERALLVLTTTTPPGFVRLTQEVARRTKGIPKGEEVAAVLQMYLDYRPLLQMLGSHGLVGEYPLWADPLKGDERLTSVAASSGVQLHPELRDLTADEIRQGLEDLLTGLLKPFSFRVVVIPGSLEERVFVPEDTVLTEATRGRQRTKISYGLQGTDGVFMWKLAQVNSPEMRRRHPDIREEVTVSDVRGQARVIRRAEIASSLASAQFFADRDFFFLKVLSHPNSEQVIPSLLFLTMVGTVRVPAQVGDGLLRLQKTYGSLSPAEIASHWDELSRDVQSTYRHCRRALVEAGIDGRFARRMMEDSELAPIARYWQFFRDERLADTTRREAFLEQDASHPGQLRYVWRPETPGAPWDALYLRPEGFISLPREGRLRIAKSVGGVRLYIDKNPAGQFVSPSGQVFPFITVPSREVTWSLLWLRKEGDRVLLPALLVLQGEGEQFRPLVDEAIGLLLNREESDNPQDLIERVRQRVMAIYYREFLRETPPEGDSHSSAAGLGEARG